MRDELKRITTKISLTWWFGWFASNDSCAYELRCVQCTKIFSLLPHKQTHLFLKLVIKRFVSLTITFIFSILLIYFILCAVLILPFSAHLRHESCESSSSFDSLLSFFPFVLFISVAAIAAPFALHKQNYQNRTEQNKSSPL